MTREPTLSGEKLEPLSEQNRASIQTDLGQTYWEPNDGYVWLNVATEGDLNRLLNAVREEGEERMRLAMKAQWREDEACRRLDYVRANTAGLRPGDAEAIAAFQQEFVARTEELRRLRVDTPRSAAFDPGQPGRDLESLCDAQSGGGSERLTVLSYHADFSGDDGEDLITWTFYAPRETRVEAGLYELRRLRALMPEEFDMAPTLVLQRTPSPSEPALETPPGARRSEATGANQTSDLEGWVLVPREPTEDMVGAYFDTLHRHGFHAGLNASAAYAAMLSALPQPPRGGGE